jgi:hypothetical protein
MFSCCGCSSDKNEEERPKVIKVYQNEESENEELSDGYETFIGELEGLLQNS